MGAVLSSSVLIDIEFENKGIVNSNSVNIIKRILDRKLCVTFAAFLICYAAAAAAISVV